jgi:hypothetical protein
VKCRRCSTYSLIDLSAVNLAVQGTHSRISRNGVSTAGSPEMVEAFGRREHALRWLVGEKYRRDQVEGNGTVFLRPADLSLLR